MTIVNETVIDSLEYVRSIEDACTLLKLGDRTNSICTLTGLPNATVNRLSREVLGRGPKSGQLVYTDFWFVKLPERMMHASIIWHMERKYELQNLTPVQNAIQMYRSYLRMTDGNPLISMSRALFIKKLVLMGEWGQRKCRDCHSIYLSRVTSRRVVCYSCELDHKMHCENCGELIKGKKNNSRRRFCDNNTCAAEKRQQNKQSSLDSASVNFSTANILM